jgi:hypothetical protein
MYSRCFRIVALAITLLLHPPLYRAADTKNQPMTRETRMLVIRSLNAEFAYVRRVIPAGLQALVIKGGQIVSPPPEELQRLSATYAPAAKPGDRVQITSIEIKNDKMLFAINGGPKKKAKWYQRIEVGGLGGTMRRPDDNAANISHGWLLELDFDRFVPEMTGDQVRELLSPVIDFKATSAVEAYLDTVPPKVKEAIKNHQVLVGMNRQMVSTAKGRPEKKIREKDEQGREYEEWLYGQPPEEVQFVRFIGDEVVQLKIMKVDGERIVRTEKEVDAGAMVAERKPKSASPPPVPTLKRPGEMSQQDQRLPAGSEPASQPPAYPPLPPPVSAPGSDPGTSLPPPG